MFRGNVRVTPGSRDKARGGRRREAVVCDADSAGNVRRVYPLFSIVFGILIERVAFWGVLPLGCPYLSFIHR